MKKFIVLFVALVSFGFCGTITNPTVLISGQSYQMDEDSSKNYFIFNMKANGNIAYFCSGANNWARITVLNANTYKKIDTTDCYSYAGSITLSSGTYILQATKFYQEKITVASPQISGHNLTCNSSATSNTFSVSLDKGWNNVGTGKMLNNMEIFNNGCISEVIVYRNGGWLRHKVGGASNIVSINANEGFWINATTSGCTVSE